VTAILKLRRGVVQEVGIADKSLTRRRRTEFGFLTSFYSASWKSPEARRPARSLMGEADGKLPRLADSL
jgi:hypothetical protein